MNKIISWFRNKPTLSILILVVLYVWFINFSPKVDSSDYSAKVKEIQTTGNLEKCNFFKNTHQRMSCQKSVLNSWFDDPYVEDCMNINYSRERGYCLFLASDSAYYSSPDDCNKISDWYYRRWCHSYQLPDELSQLGGVDTYVDFALSVSLMVAFFYFIFAWYYKVGGSYPSRFSRIFIAFVTLVVAFIFLSSGNYLNLFFYHFTVLSEAVCSTGGMSCVESDWITLPTLKGLVFFVIFMPMFYFYIGKLAMWIHKKYIEDRSSFGFKKFLNGKKSKYIILVLLFIIISCSVYKFNELNRPMEVFKSVRKNNIQIKNPDITNWVQYSDTLLGFKYPPHSRVYSEKNSVNIDLSSIFGLESDTNSDKDFSYPMGVKLVFDVTLEKLDDNTYIDIADYMENQGVIDKIMPYQKCKVKFIGIEKYKSCIVYDYVYGYGISRFTRYHYYLLHNNYLIHITFIGPNGDLSRASYMEREYYKYMLNFEPMAVSILESLHLYK